MATNATTIKNGACWYGLHIGCLYTNNPNCTKCAMRLAHAVNSTLGSEAPSWESVDAARADAHWCRPVDSPTTYAGGGLEAGLEAAVKQQELELREIQA